MKWRITVAGDEFTPDDVARCARALEEGDIGIIPTDTVYGIAALANDSTAVARVMEIKGRPPGKPLPVQARGLEDASLIAAMEDPVARALALDFWPGPLTLVLPRRGDTVLPFQDEETIGVRVPGSAFDLELLAAAGFLVVPSANPAGAPPPEEVSEIAAEIIGAVDFVVDAGPCPCGVESTVVRVVGGTRILRGGAIAEEELLRVIRRAMGEERS
jgi:L-threonylcarbamoyladenylate synthase